MIRAGLLALSLVLANAASAQELAPDTSPVPDRRPAAASAAGTPAPAEETAPQATGAGTAASDDPGPSATPGRASPSAPAPGAGLRDRLRLDDTGLAACLAELADLGAVFVQSAPIVPEDDADCGILQPLTVSEILPGVALVPPAVLRCPTARALAVWTRDFVRPAARRLEGERGALTVIRNGSGYVCRRRNNAPDGKLSEHAFGNAFDVMGFEFASGAPVPIEPREAEGTMAEAFQDAVRASACLDFSTVLGPGSDASHDDHLHLDIIQRRGGYRLCEQGGGQAE